MFQAIEIHGLGKDGKISQQEVRGEKESPHKRPQNKPQINKKPGQTERN